MCSADIFLGLIALLFPPLPVWVKRGICSADSLINILLCILGFVPGLLHSWYIIAKFPDAAYYDYEGLPQDRERGQITYFYVGAAPSQQPQPQAQSQSQSRGGPPTGGQVNYGTQGGTSVHAQEQGVTSHDHDSAVPPSYASVVTGDNKVQSRD